MTIEAMIDAVIGREGGLFAPVPHLLRSGRPATIPRLIVTIHVDTIKGHSVRALAHILKKCLKRVLPTVAHRNAPSSVYRVFYMINFIASRLGRLPRSIGWMRTKPVRHSMLELHCSQLLTVQATAASRISRRKFVSRFGSDFSTFAKANPSRPFPARGRPYGHVTFDYFQPSVDMVGAINQGAHCHA